jgi:hypothetical protein
MYTSPVCRAEEMVGSKRHSLEIQNREIAKFKKKKSLKNWCGCAAHEL